MNTFMEQFAESERWTGRGQHGLDAQPDAMSGENPWSLTNDLTQARRNALLTSIVEAEILPRLARLRRDAAATRAGTSTMKTHADASAMTTDDDTQELVRLLLHEETSDTAGFVDSLRRRGATPGSLYLGVLTRAAQVLGEMWDQDSCDFAQVTIGMGRLQQVLRALSPHFQTESLTRAHAATVLLAPGPGDQHTFGLLMLAEFFKREGWHVAGGPATSASDAVLTVRRAWVDVAGFSIGSFARLEGLAQCIRAVRRASRNPNLYVMVGGPLLLARPGLVARTGADAAATDATGAVRQANRLLGMGAAAD